MHNSEFYTEVAKALMCESLSMRARVQHNDLISRLLQFLFGFGVQVRDELELRVDEVAIFPRVLLPCVNVFWIEMIQLLKAKS
jgi:hypothetical protein